MTVKSDIYNALLAYWDFDGGDPAQTLVDRSGNVDLPFAGNSPENFSLIAGINGLAGSFSGDSSGFEKNGIGDYFDFRNRSFFISTWYYGGSSAVGRWVHFTDQPGTDDQVRLGVSSGEIGFWINGSIVHQLNEPIKATAGWHHVLVGVESGVKRVLYHDGVLAQSSTSGSAGYDANYGRVEISGGSSTSESQQPLDEILVAELAPTDEIAEWLYNDGAGRGWWDIAPIPEDEEVFQASFEDVSGRDPLPTALLERTPARQLANHLVNVYRYPPYRVTKRLPVTPEQYPLTKPTKMMWHQDAMDPLFFMGRWAQIQGRRFTDNPLEVEFDLRISDHAESFEKSS